MIHAVTGPHSLWVKLGTDIKLGTDNSKWATHCALCGWGGYGHHSVRTLSTT